MKLNGQLHIPVAYLWGKGTHWTGRWASPRADLDMVTKKRMLSLLEFEPQPSWHWANPAHMHEKTQ
jgi:hypothetical protein